MAEFSKLIITGAGQALIAKVIAGTGNIRFTKVSTSDTAYEENKLEELTELSGIKQTSLISDIVRTNEVAVKIETAFHNTELTEGYYMRTMGLYAVDPDEGEILYAVTVETSGNCYIPPYNGVTVSGAYVQLITTVGNAEQVSLEVDAAAVATIGDLRELEEKIENLKMDLGDANVQFVEYETRENIQAQDTLGTMFGKIKKWFTDLKAGAFSGVANNCTTTEEGSVLDARQGKMLLEEIEELKKVDEEINSNIETLGGFTPVIDSTGKITGYKTEAGADTVFPFKSGIKTAISAAKNYESAKTHTITASSLGFKRILGVMYITSSDDTVGAKTCTTSDNGSSYALLVTGYANRTLAVRWIGEVD